MSYEITSNELGPEVVTSNGLADLGFLDGSALGAYCTSASESDILSVMLHLEAEISAKALASSSEGTALPVTVRKARLIVTFWWGEVSDLVESRFPAGNQSHVALRAEVTQRLRGLAGEVVSPLSLMGRFKRGVQTIEVPCTVALMLVA